jgi:segregation and condensation protein B
MSDITLENAILAILFYQAEPLSFARLAHLLKHSQEEIVKAVEILEAQLSTSGLRLVRMKNEVVLTTAPEASSLIDAITKEELSKELSKASLETLSIVLYKGPLSRAEIDHIRGVNSTFILRNLLIRGLVEKIDNPNDQRSFLYKPTFALLEYMGVTKVEELPAYEETMHTLEGFLSTQKEEGKNEPSEIVKEGEEITNNEYPTEEPGRDHENIEHDELLADLAEEDIAGENFLDQELDEHTEEDRATS